jgi:hypothetical protein
MYTKRSAIAIFVIAATMAIATVTFSIATPVLADKNSAHDGLEKADDNVHDNAPGGLGGDIDQKFHNGLCHGGHSTDAFQCP